MFWKVSEEQKKKIFDDSKSKTISFFFISLLALLFRNIRERKKILCHERLDIKFLFVDGSRSMDSASVL